MVLGVDLCVCVGGGGGEESGGGVLSGSTRPLLSEGATDSPHPPTGNNNR